ncbi:MFS transporter, partial [Pseudomonas aeruginosa]|uniref:MFS transporter n=1 Tax=Pseudomonas aeruginosa TaxID=287 RepID=UPI0031B6B11D
TGVKNIVTTNDTTHPAVFFIQCIYRRTGDAFDTFFLLVSFANSFSLLLIGRACLGLALGGFWAMSASLTMRLVPPRTVPKALSVIFGAVSIALVIAAPLGSFLGELIGWRNVF